MPPEVIEDDLRGSGLAHVDLEDEQVRGRQGRDGCQIDTDRATLWADSLENDLEPAAGCGSQVDDVVTPAE